MRFIAPLTLLLATAAASPKPGHKLIPRETLAGMTVAAAQGTCGNDQKISCCNEVTGSERDGAPSGLLGGLLNGLLGGLLGDGLLGQCSGLDLSSMSRSLDSQHCVGFNK